MPANSKIARAFRTQVLDRMDELGVTIADLATGLKMSRPGLSRVLNGHADVTLTRAAKIADFLKIELSISPIREKSRQSA